MLKKKMMKRKILFVTCLILGAMICLPAEAVIITPSNIVMPTVSGDTFSFDMIIDNPTGAEVGGFGVTFSVSRAGLTFDATASEGVVGDSGYWAFENSVGAFAEEDIGSSSYTFSDNSNDPAIVELFADDIMARYAFTWDGTVGDYTFTLDFDTTKSYALIDGWNTQALKFKDPDHPELGDDASSFTVTIPEPATLTLMCLGTVVLRKKRLFP